MPLPAVLTPERARALLRGGADVHARAVGVADAPSPFELAAAHQSGGAAQLVVRAAAPWSPETHELFPAAARARVPCLLWLGKQLSKELRVGGAGGVKDLWVPHVMPHAVVREKNYYY